MCSTIVGRKKTGRKDKYVAGGKCMHIDIINVESRMSFTRGMCFDKA